MLERWSKMSVRNAMIDLAGRPPMHGELQRWLSRLSSKTGLTYRTMRSLWTGEINRPDHLAAEKVRAMAKAETERRERVSVATQFESMAGALNARDPDFHSADISSLLHAADLLRKMDCT